MISSAAIRQTRVVLETRKEPQPVAFFYCSFSTQETQDVRTILVSLLFQLCKARPALWDDVVEQYLISKHQLQYAASKMSVEECLHVLKQGSGKASGAYLFLDAVNESKQWRAVLDMVKNLLQVMPSVRIMISSTEGLDDPFKAGEAGLVLMGWRTISEDIESYIETTIETDPHLAPLPYKLKLEIRSTLLSNNDGMSVNYSWKGY